MHHRSQEQPFFEIAIYAYNYTRMCVYVYAYVRILIRVCAYVHMRMCVYSYAYVRIIRVCTVNVYLSGTVRLLFRNAHAVSKNKKSLADYRWLCDLDELKGLATGATYRNSKACGTFTKYIATAAQSQVAEELTNAKFVSVMSDGATESSITEQEIVFVRLQQQRCTTHQICWIEAAHQSQCQWFAQSYYGRSRRLWDWVKI